MMDRAGRCRRPVLAERGIIVCLQRPAASGRRTSANALAKITVADFGGTGVSDCAVGNTARDTSGSKSISLTKGSRKSTDAVPAGRDGRSRR